MLSRRERRSLLVAACSLQAQSEKTLRKPQLRQIIDVLQQVMCTHDAEKLAISVLGIYKDCYRGE